MDAFWSLEGSGTSMERISNDDFICRLPDGTFELVVRLIKFNNRLINWTPNPNINPYTLYFDCVKVDDKVIQPTTISNSKDVTYIYEKKVDNDAIIKVCYHTEAGGYNGF